MRLPWQRRRSSRAPVQRQGSRKAQNPKGSRETRLGTTRVVLNPHPTVKSARQHCEYCSARGRIRTDFSSGPLYFCGHHAYSMWSPLADKADLILIDDAEHLHWLPADLFREKAA